MPKTITADLEELRSKLSFLSTTVHNDPYIAKSHTFILKLQVLTQTKFVYLGLNSSWKMVVMFT